MSSPAREAGRDEQRPLGFLLADVLRLLRADFAARSEKMPLTPALHRLLLYVHRKPGCRQVELAEWLDVTPVTVGRMIDRLEKQKLVRRESDPDDRRAACVVVDEGAQALLARLNAMAAQTRERAFRGLSELQREALLAALVRIRDNLAGHSPAPATRRARGN